MEWRSRHDDDDDENDDEGDLLDEGEDAESAAMVEAMLSQAGSEVNLARTLTKLVTKPRILVCTPSNAACDLLLEVRACACPTPIHPRRPLRFLLDFRLQFSLVSIIL